MKKIIGAALVAALAAGVASADAKFSVNYRTGIMALNHRVSDLAGNGGGTTLFSNKTGYRSTQDALSFKGSAEYGGLELEIDPSVGFGKVEGADDRKTILEKYNGWINFGNFMIKSGTWDARAVGRVNKDIGDNEGKWWGEINKPGLAYKLNDKKLGQDISQQSNKLQTTMLQYNNKGIGLEARVAYTDGSSGSFAGADEGGDWVFANDWWFAEVGYTMKGIGRFLATTKLAHKDYAYALFYEPKIEGMDALTALVGFTGETETGKAKDEAANAFAIDARARYDLGSVVEGLSVTAMYNWTFGNDVDTNGKKPGVYGTWAMLNAMYKLNETFKPFLSFVWANSAAKTDKIAFNSDVGSNPSPTKAKFSDAFNCSLRIYLGTEIHNTAKSNIIAGICYDMANMAQRGVKDKDSMVQGVTIPVLMRIKF